MVDQGYCACTLFGFQDILGGGLMKTRDKILEKARLLFNEHGLASVSSRSISDELGISNCNLCYHFARKNDNILALN
ncbi:MAG: TetR/AcrR family transcriptional regulator, partial [Bacteroidota bacterium]